MFQKTFGKWSKIRQQMFCRMTNKNLIKIKFLLVIRQNIFCLIFGRHSPFNALTLLVGQQEGHPTCKKLGVGLLVVMIWLELCTSNSSSCHHPCYNEIQNGGLLPAYVGCIGKWPLNDCCVVISSLLDNTAKYGNLSPNVSCLLWLCFLPFLTLCLTSASVCYMLNLISRTMLNIQFVVG